MNILISACLLGVNCRYDGKITFVEELREAIKKHSFIPVCPEQLGGLMTPRTPSERVGDKVLMKTGEDVTENFTRGAYEALRLAQLYDCKYAILKERSPSCGSETIYDGTFSGTLVKGMGVTADLLRKNGITVLNECGIVELLTKPQNPIEYNGIRGI